MLKLPRTVSSQRRSTVSMAIRRHEIYGKSRRSVSLQLPSDSHSSLKLTAHLTGIQTLANSLVNFGFYWWSQPEMSGSTTGVPPHCRAVAGWTSHQTEWVILSPRRDPHRKSNHQSTAFAAHYTASGTPHSLYSACIPSLIVLFNLCVPTVALKVSYFNVNVYFFLFSFTFWEEEEAAPSWRVNGIPSPRDGDVVDILVRHQEVRKRRRPKPKRRKF